MNCSKVFTILAVSALMLFFSGCKKETGCADTAAINYNPDAEEDDGSCLYYNECTDPATYTDLTFAQKGSNVLIYNVNFKTAETFASRLLAIGSGNDTIITGWTSAGVTHQIVLIGLRSSSTYKVKIQLQGTNCVRTSADEFEINTGSLPSDLKNYSVSMGDASAMSGFVLSNIMDIYKFNGSLTSLYQPYVVIVDREGYVVWYRYFDNYIPVSFSVTPFKSLLVFAVTADVSERLIMEINLEGDVLLNLPLSSFATAGIIHHEIKMDNQRNITALFTEQRLIDRSSVGGSPDEKIIGDKIMKISETGTILWEWSTFDVFDPLILSGEAGFYDFIYGAGTEDWLHTNAFAFDHDGNIIISLKIHNMLAKINYNDGTLMWTLGETGSLNIGTDLHIYHQHSITVLPNGHYLLYDNGDENLRPYSRIIEFTVNGTNSSASLVWEKILPSDLSSDFESNAIRLSNGNTLVASTFASTRLFTLNASGQVIWGLDTKGLMMYRAYHIPDLY